MLEGYKTLRALQDTGGESFTVEDLAAASDVGPATIRTVLAREALVEEIGTQRTGRRGASPKIYRLREGAQPKLDERLGAIEELGRPLDDERESLVISLEVGFCALHPVRSSPAGRGAHLAPSSVPERAVLRVARRIAECRPVGDLDV